MTIAEVLELITQGGVVALLVLIVVGGMRRWYVWSWQYREQQRDLEEWKAMALGNLGLADYAARAAEAAKKKADAS
jgi:hypothetical protein